MPHRPVRLFAPALALLAASGTAAVPALTASSALLGTGCTTCTLAYAPGGAWVSLQLEDPSGAYHVEVEGAGETLTAAITPTAPGLCPGCTAEGERLLIELSPPQPAGATMVTLWVSDLTGQAEPDQLTVRVYRGAELRLERVLRPDYQIDEPNGPGCGEVATASLAVPVP